jgi:spermidine synthase
MHIQMNAVEISRDVCYAARRYFGVAALESSRYRLHTGCAMEWLATAEDGSIDVLVVDLEDGSSARSDALIAPPPPVLSQYFLEDAASAMAQGGVIAINAIGSKEQLDTAMNKISAALPAHYSHASCTVSPEVDPSGRHQIFFHMNTHPAFSAGSVPNRENLASELDMLPTLVDNRQSWLRGFLNHTWKGKA